MKNKIFITICMIVCVFFFASCKEKEPVGDSGTNQGTNNHENVPQKTDYYSIDNFIESSKEVTTTKLVTYDGPSYLTPSNKCEVSVEGKDLFVYQTRVNHGRQFSWMLPTDMTDVVIFDFEGKVHVEVKVLDENITSAKVLPLVYGISCEVKDNVISFDLEYSGNYVLEYNDDSNNALHIFANPIEENPITEEDANNNPKITYIGPGVYKADAIPVSDDQTIYLAGGAYVYGQIRAEGINNLTIRGRGIISGALYNRRSESEYTIPIEMRYCDNVKIEGITFLDPAGWTMALYKSTNVTVDNVKMITARQNGDGISVQACENVTVTGGFVRTWDDSLVVKNVDGGSTNHIKFEGVTVWTDLAQSMEVGYEANGASMNDVVFNNIVVIHNFHKAVISMHNADDAQISNVKYTNIIVEDCQTLGDNRSDGENDFLIDICVLYNQDWSNSTNIKGTVRDVLIENVKVYKMASTVMCRINGYSPTSNISGVTIKGVEVEGKKLTSTNDLKLVTNDFTSSVSIERMDKVIGAKITLPYKLQLSDTNVNKQNNENVTQIGMLIPEFARAKGDLPYIGVAEGSTYSAVATHSAGNKTTTPADDGSGDFTRSGSSAASAVDKDPTTSWISGTWTNEENEFAALTIDFGGKLLNVGVIRILGNQSNEFYYTYSFQIWGMKVKSDGTVNDKYTRLLALKDYEMTPGSNNCIDVNITTQEYAGLQIRFYRNDYDSSPEYYEVSEIQLFAPSLSYNKAIVDSTPHNDVYNVEKAVDGDATGTSYYESAELPAYIVIDLGDVYELNAIVLCLPPSLKWDARTQEIEILASASVDAYSASTSFNTIVEKTSFLFDPQTGNRNIINLESGVSARYIKVIIYSNNIRAGYNAQLSEISVYGK